MLAFGSDSPGDGGSTRGPPSARPCTTTPQPPGSPCDAPPSPAPHTRAGHRAAGDATTALTGSSRARRTGALRDLGRLRILWIFPKADSPSCLRTVHRGRVLFARDGALV